VGSSTAEKYSNLGGDQRLRKPRYDRLEEYCPVIAYRLPVVRIEGAPPSVPGEAQAGLNAHHAGRRQTRRHGMSLLDAAEMI
jgi:hypothetical protein